MVKYLLSLFLLFSFFSCQNNSNSNESIGLKLVCETLPNHSNERPSNKIQLELNGKKYPLANILTCEKFDKSDYQDHDIPSKAIDAAGGWWAGSGEYFYIEKKPNGRYAIMYGQMYEEKETRKYDYTQLAEVKKNDLNQFSFFPKFKKKDLVGVYILGGHQNSWVLVLKPNGEEIQAMYYEIDGNLPSVDVLVKNLPQPQVLQKFDIDFSDMVIDSDLGLGQYEAIFGRERITFFDKKSHQEDVLRLTKDNRYNKLLVKVKQ